MPIWQWIYISCNFYLKTDTRFIGHYIPIYYVVWVNKVSFSTDLKAPIYNGG
jgi:hypothetical protein